MDQYNRDVLGSVGPAGNRSVAIQAGELAPRAGTLAAFSNTLNPVGPVENFVVADLSWCASQTREFEAALDALRREGEVALSSILSTSDGNSLATLNLARASVLGSERHEVLMRQRFASSRGFLRALNALRDVRAPVRELVAGSLFNPDPRFVTEQACLTYLVRRYGFGRCACRRCGAASAGSFIAATAAWQCGRCHAQTGLRCGTCMERSKVPLTKWFAAIRIVLQSPTITTNELATALKIERRQTVRSMIRRIRATVDAQDPSAALAGLDELYLSFA